MKLNIFDKILIVLVIILIGIAGHNIYKYNTPMNKQIRELIKPRIGKVHPQKFTINLKDLSKKYHIYEDLYNTDETIITFGYEDRPMELGYGKDFHDDFLKRLKEENINYKVVPYHNYEDIKQDIIKQKGNANTGCSANNGLEEDLNSLIKETETCLINICLINNKKSEFILISRQEIDFAIKTFKELSEENKSN